jgi:D-aminopeptidase
MKTSTPIRIDAELYAAATAAAPVMSRSTTQQIAHWARIGRELEASAEVSIEHLAEVLRGQRSYDTLGVEEQAVARAYWAERMAALSRALRLDVEYTAEGRPYVELDEDGAVVRRDPAKSAAKAGAGTR